MKYKPEPSKELDAELKRLGDQIAWIPAKEGSAALEQAFRESAARFNLIFNNAAVGIAVVDSKGRFTDSNQTWLDMIGYSREELGLMHIQDVTALDEPLINPRTYQGLDKYSQIEKRYLRKNGTEFWGDLCAGTIADAQGNVVGMVGVIINISERKIVEQNLRESEEKHRNLFETTAQGIVYQNEHGEILEANPAALEILGQTLDQMQGRTSLDPRWQAIREDGTDFDGELHPAMIALHTGKPVHDVVMGIYNPRLKNIRWLNINATPQFKPDGVEPYQVFSTFCDITDRVRADAEVRTRLAFEKAYVNISARFVGNQDLHEAIHGALGEIGIYSNAGRTFLSQICEDGQRMEMSHEWCDPSRSPRLESPKGFLTADYPWLMSQLETGDPVVVKDIDKLPPEASGFRESLQVQNISAVLAIPIQGSGRLTGFLGFEFSEGTRPWEERDQTLLKITAEIIGHALEKKRVGDKLQQAYNWQEAIFEGSRDAIMISDERGQIIAANHAASVLTGHAIDDLLNIPLTALHNSGGFRSLQSIQDRIMAGEETTSQVELKQKNGTEIHVEFSNRRILVDNIPYMHTVARDISERKSADERLRQTESRLHTILNNTPVILWSVDECGKFVLSLGKGLEPLGLGPDEVVGLTVYEVYKDFPAIINDVEKALLGKTFTAVHDVNGVYFETRFAPLKDSAGSTKGCIGISIDITERKKFENQLTYLATHDLLTRLPNRMAFNDRLSLALAQARRNQGNLALLLLDLDNFKDINDTLGHDSGDKLLALAGQRLRDLVRKTDIVARIGGDEFMLLIAELKKAEDTEIVAEKILEAFRKPFKFNGYELTVTTSIGIAVFPQDGDKSEDLKKHADIALYRAKDLGRDNAQHFHKPDRPSDSS